MNTYPTTNKSAGFSLIEMAMVMVILALLLGGLFTAVGSSTENMRRSNTTTLLKQVEEALYGFAQANGRLPCPANNASAVEIADCSTGNHHGFVPTATLGLSGNTNANGILLDAWQNPLRYSVNPAFAAEYSTIKNDLFPNWISSPPASDTLKICNNAGCDPDTVIANRVPAVVLSLGPNWATFSSADEIANTDGSDTFVSAPYNEALFDDQIIWLSPHILFSRMVRAGRLP